MKDNVYWIKTGLTHGNLYTRSFITALKIIWSSKSVLKIRQRFKVEKYNSEL